MKTKLEGVRKKRDGTEKDEVIEIGNERRESSQMYTEKSDETPLI